jgi:hypothetical protein
VATTLNLFSCAIIPLTTLWAIFAMLAASRRPPYSVADWQEACDRISQNSRRLQSTPGPGSRFHRATCGALLQDLIANTAFILNLVNGACRHLHEPEINRARDVLGQSAALLLRLHCARLQLFFWPHASAPRWRALAVADGYLCLCLALAGFLERYAYCKAGGSCPREAQTAP